MTAADTLNTPAHWNAQEAAWWRGAVIYHIYPLSFADSNDDGYGDLPGVTQRLEYVRSLGVDAIWLSPFYRSPMRDFGYDISDYREVDPLFGSLADFDALIARAHALGLKVILDQVYSHTSDQHAWFQESRADRANPKADWYVWADAKPDGSPPTNWQSVFKGAAWTWDARRRQYYLNNFQSEQPDLNVHNPDVQNALLEVARFWLDRGVDGFRLDAINFAMHDPQLRDNPPVTTPGPRTRPFDFQHHFYNQSHPDIPVFLERVRALADAYGAFLVAEVGGEQADAEMKLYTAGGRRLHTAYGFQYLYAQELTPALVRATLGEWISEGEEGWPAWAFSNHDAPRVLSRWPTRHAKAAELYMLLLLSLRGSAFIYQGEELGLPQGRVPVDRLRDPEAIANWPLTLGRDGARTPMPWSAGAANAGFSSAAPWLPVDPAHPPLAVDAQENDPNSTLAFTRRLIALRESLPAMRGGAQTFLDAPKDMLVFARGDGEALCAFNLSDRAAAWSLPKGYEIVARVNHETASGPMFPAFAGIVARRR
ncbi:MAG TPA: alpha-amylase family glycosyl hydrolase [Caulobacterales bacterium]|nr:alpha-amylase family glycosyl hydrolase [Caulobacterales bacterium]